MEQSLKAGKFHSGWWASEKRDYMWNRDKEKTWSPLLMFDISDRAYRCLWLQCIQYSVFNVLYGWDKGLNRTLGIKGYVFLTKLQILYKIQIAMIYSGTCNEHIKSVPW